MAPPCARLIAQFGLEDDQGPGRARLRARLLPFMEAASRRLAIYLAAEHPTLADLACYSYIAHAPEGGIPLEPYPAIRANGSPGSKPCPSSSRSRLHPCQSRRKPMPLEPEPFHEGELAAQARAGDGLARRRHPRISCRTSTESSSAALPYLFAGVREPERLADGDGADRLSRASP